MILSKGAVALKVVVTHSEDNLWPTIPATTATAAAAAAASVCGSSMHGGGSSQYTAGTAYGSSTIAETPGTVLTESLLHALLHKQLICLQMCSQQHHVDAQIKSFERKLLELIRGHVLHAMCNTMQPLTSSCIIAELYCTATHCFHCCAHRQAALHVRAVPSHAQSGSSGRQAKCRRLVR
jgi:hypothetical protein